MVLSSIPIGKPAVLLAVALYAITIVGGALPACAQNLDATEPPQLRPFNPLVDIPTERILVPGLVGWWPFDETEGLVAPDAAGSNDGSLVGFNSPRWPRGELGRALEFNGDSANRVVIANAPALNPGTQISLSAWIYSNTEEIRHTETIISKGVGEDTQYALAIERGGVIRFTLGESSLSSEKRIVPHTWTHVLASYDGEAMRLYLDGQVDRNSLERRGPIAATDNEVLIGSSSNATQLASVETPPATFNGILDDVRIYSVGLNFASVASLYAEGIHNSNSAFEKHWATLNYGNTYSIDSVPAAGVLNYETSWWQGWVDYLKGTSFPPGASWATACNAPIDKSGKTLECYLQKNPNVASAIVWRSIGSKPQTEVDLPWSQWDAQQKQDLAEAFYYAFEWMNGGLQSYGGYNLVDPPVNQFNQPDAAPAVTEFTPDAAWHLYVNTIAQSLAVEIGQFVPWSIYGYSSTELQSLFDSNNIVSLQLSSRNVLDSSIPMVWGYVPAGDTMNAPPTTAFQFLVNQNMIQANQKTTIQTLIDWSRYNLLHIEDWTDDSAAAFQGWWNYRGSSPASAVLSGTLGRYQPIPPYPPALIHNWVDGCHGVVTLYRGMLQTVNIPTDYVVEFGHGMPIWWTVSEALSHGDDVETWILIKNGAEPNLPNTWEKWPKFAPASDYPISITDFNDWFIGPNSNSLDVGRQTYVLTIKYPDDDLLTSYCYDKAHGLSPANGTVLASLQGSLLLQLFPLQTLESMGFWNTLSAESTYYGVCGP
jgi:hypothetical protein